MTMVTHDPRSQRGTRIDDRRGSHTVTSPSGVQETGSGTTNLKRPPIWPTLRLSRRGKHRESRAAEAENPPAPHP